MAKTTKSYSKMLKEELLAIAQRLGLTNLSRLRKDEIIDLIVKATAKQEKAATAVRSKTKSAASAAATKAEAVVAPTTEDTGAAEPGAKKGSAAKAAESAVGKAKKAAKTATKAAAAARRGKTSSTTKKSSAGAAAPEERQPTAVSGAAGAPLSGGVPGQPRPSKLGPVSAQTNAQASKFAGSAAFKADDLAALDESLPELPESYGDNRIVLLPRDISWLFTYWDLTEEYKEAARAAGGSVLALRLYDVTGVDFDGTNAHAMYEHECAEWARSWYLPTPTPDRDFIVEIGYRGGDQWFPLARSNKVAVPSDQPSTWIKDDFISIRFEEDLQKAQERLQPEHHAEAPPAPSPGYGPMPIPGQTIFDDGQVRVMVGGTFLSPSGVPSLPLFSGAEYLQSSQALVAGSQAFIPGSQAFIPGSQAFVPGSQAFVPGSQAFVAGSHAFLPGSHAFLPGSQGFLAGSYGFLPSSPGFARPRVPVEEELAGQPGGGVNGAPGQPGAAGVEGEAEPEPEPPVVLTTMEMIISGKSEPGTDLRIAGRSIPLGPDGAFSLRITVPEGLRELPIEARAATSPKPRRITLRLGHETE